MGRHPGTICLLGLTTLLVLVSPARGQPSPINSQQPDGSQSPLDLLIVMIGVGLVLAETYVWWLARKESTLVAFAMEPVEISSSYNQSHNDFTSEKNEAVSEDAEPQADSPGVKTIKEMTEKKEKDLKEEDSERRRRKRKADKLSDRKQAQPEQQRD